MELQSVGEVSVVSFGRVLLVLALVLGAGLYLMMSGEWEDPRINFAFAIGLLVLFSLVLFTGGKGKSRKRARSRHSRSATPTTETAASASIDVPEPVVEEEDAGTRRGRKLAKADSAEDSAEAEDEEEVVVLDEEAIEDEVHVAEEYVVDIDAQTLEEADIEEFIDDRRDKRAAIKDRIEMRRRGQLADIRASAARMWAQHDEGEDLLALLSRPGHGLEVLDEPEKVAPGHPYGATYVRLDDARVLKVRVPLDEGYVAASELEDEDEALPDLPPPPDGLPLPPPPSGAQSKLDEMRDEIGD
ncbi:MAG: hypothetical protein CXX71_02125 [Methanobacteriota archaeon]|nr:MAG: hypothetical protein CXX71_02125 [Euryarchaeota archaeon]